MSKEPHPLVAGMAKTLFPSKFAEAHLGGRKEGHDHLIPPTDTSIRPPQGIPHLEPVDVALLNAIAAGDKGLEKTLTEIRDELQKVPREDRHKLLQKLEDEMRASQLEKRRQRDKANIEINRLDRIVSEFEECEKWAKLPLKLEKPSAMMFSSMRTDFSKGLAFHSTIEDTDKDQNLFYEKEFFRHAQIFVIEHDWASAFERADIDAPFKLPYEACAFEFQISGRVIIGLAVQTDETVMLSVVAKSSHGWVVPGSVYSNHGIEWSLKDDKDDGYGNVVRLVGAQIRACSIALDAEVAVTEIIRAPHQTTNLGRNTYTPLKSYHIVSLARRSRAPALESSETKRRIRLHFRRGHWRHFESHKTWIKWMLVGDPDLGFIDKHYKL